VIAGVNFVVMVMGLNFCVCEREGWVMVVGGARFSRNLLKFTKCRYWCLITALYGSPGKIIRRVLGVSLSQAPATTSRR
jgi:hypothetical protein